MNQGCITYWSLHGADGHKDVNNLCRVIMQLCRDWESNPLQIYVTWKRRRVKQKLKLVLELHCV